jgi:hypothetical protein
MARLAADGAGARRSTAQWLADGAGRSGWGKAATAVEERRRKAATAAEERPRRRPRRGGGKPRRQLRRGRDGD